MSERWTSETSRRLEQLWADKRSASVCASVMSREFGQPFTRNCIVGKAWREGLPTIGHPKGAKRCALRHKMEALDIGECIVFARGSRKLANFISHVNQYSGKHFVRRTDKRTRRYSVTRTA